MDYGPSLLRVVDVCIGRFQRKLRLQDKCSEKQSCSYKLQEFHNQVISRCEASPKGNPTKDCVKATGIFPRAERSSGARTSSCCGCGHLVNQKLQGELSGPKIQVGLYFTRILRGAYRYSSLPRCD